MRRRQFIGYVSAAVVAPPWPAGAQRPAPAIGFLSSRSEKGDAPLVAALLRGLAEAGSAEGRDFAIQYRFAEGQQSRRDQFAAEFDKQGVALIVAGDTLSALAAQRAAAKIPVVFFSGGDPVKLGLVASFNRPGGRLTGVAQLNHAITAKRLELLRDIVPGHKSIAFFHDANNPSAADEPKDVLAAAKQMGQELHMIAVSSADNLPAAFGQAVTLQAGAILLGSGPVFTNGRRVIVDLAERHRIPAAYSLREFVDAGGLVSYGSDLRDGFLQMGRYAGRILKGEQPADLPVVQPTKFELVINLKTANALGLVLPPTLLARADNVIE